MFIIYHNIIRIYHNIIRNLIVLYYIKYIPFMMYVLLKQNLLSIGKSVEENTCIKWSI